MLDPGTGITYTSMLDTQLEYVFSAMKNLGFEGVEVMVGETGIKQRGHLIASAVVGATGRPDHHRQRAIPPTMMTRARFAPKLTINCHVAVKCQRTLTSRVE
jgi:hypothetical protein